MHAEGDPPIKSTALGFEILATLHDRGGATLSELVDHFERPKNTVHDHLMPLSKLGYLSKDGQTFRVGVRFLNLGGRARSRTEPFQVAEREGDRLAFNTGERANLMVEENGSASSSTARGTAVGRAHTYEGMEVHLRTTAMRKAILAERTRSRPSERGTRVGLPSEVLGAANVVEMNLQHR